MEKVIEQLVKFRDDRNWKQFHTPENLVKSIVIEASELLENYQWGRDEDVDLQNVQEEIADVVGYCLLLCEHYGFDLETIMNQKIKLNNEKYPVDKAYGKADKYTKL